MENHRESKHHQAGLLGKANLLQLDQQNFTEKFTSSFLATDIPFHKLNHTVLKSLFGAREKVLPSEAAAQASIAKLASQKEN